MPISIACPVCGVRLRAPDFSVGQAIPCPCCKELVRIPEDDKRQRSKKTMPEREQFQASEPTDSTPTSRLSVPPLPSEPLPKFTAEQKPPSNRGILIAITVLVAMGVALGFAVVVWQIHKDAATAERAALVIKLREQADDALYCLKAADKAHDILIKLWKDDPDTLNKIEDEKKSMDFHERKLRKIIAFGKEHGISKEEIMQNKSEW